MWLFKTTRIASLTEIRIPKLFFFQKQPEKQAMAYDRRKKNKEEEQLHWKWVNISCIILQLYAIQ